MKKQWLIALVVGAVSLTSAGAFALGVGNLKKATNGAVDKAAKAAVQSSINDNLSKKSCNCVAGKVDATCMKTRVKDLQAQHAVAEKSGFADFDVKIVTPKLCRDSVQDEVRSKFSYWDSSVDTKSSGTTVDFSVKLN